MGICYKLKFIILCLDCKGSTMGIWWKWYWVVAICFLYMSLLSMSFLLVVFPWYTKRWNVWNSCLSIHFCVLSRNGLNLEEPIEKLRFGRRYDCIIGKYYEHWIWSSLWYQYGWFFRFVFLLRMYAAIRCLVMFYFRHLFFKSV